MVLTRVGPPRFSTPPRRTLLRLTDTDCRPVVAGLLPVAVLPRGGALLPTTLRGARVPTRTPFLPAEPPPRDLLVPGCFLALAMRSSKLMLSLLSLILPACLPKIHETAASRRSRLC